MPVADQMLSLKQISDLLNCEIICGTHALNRAVQEGIASDRMSYVLASGAAGKVLITRLASSQAVRTAYITDSVAVIFVMGEKPDPNTIDVGNQTDIPILSTALTFDETCARLKNAGLAF